ncbi:hypothetical protein Y032_0001g52 [Ancylostoma ceylanicum]|uniref:Uncharacterized protein n=1 Tax=Ancylostoma ceylanicum TaxID=53326 RepID=A0A016W6J4_9BILA|nr:hypothetical protein Y032_0001g52 [Ancylostoma ceylanicum]
MVMSLSPQSGVNEPKRKSIRRNEPWRELNSEETSAEATVAMTAQCYANLVCGRSHLESHLFYFVKLDSHRQLGSGKDVVTARDAVLSISGNIIVHHNDKERWIG